MQVHEWPRIFFDFASVEEDAWESQAVADVSAAASPPEHTGRRCARVTVATAIDPTATVPPTTADTRPNADDAVELRRVGLGFVATTADKVAKTARLCHGVRNRRRPDRVRVRHFLRTRSYQTSPHQYRNVVVNGNSYRPIKLSLTGLSGVSPVKSWMRPLIQGVCDILRPYGRESVRWSTNARLTPDMRELTGLHFYTRIFSCHFYKS